MVIQPAPGLRSDQILDFPILDYFNFGLQLFVSHNKVGNGRLEPPTASTLRLALILDLILDIPILDFCPNSGLFSLILEFSILD